MALEELVIEINSKSTEGTQAIDNFIKSLKRLKNSLNFADKNGGDTSGIDSIVGKIGKIQTAIDGINTKKLNDLASVISGINHIKVDFGDKIAKQANKAEDAISDMKKLPSGFGNTGAGEGDTRISGNQIGTGGSKVDVSAILKSASSLSPELSKAVGQANNLSSTLGSIGGTELASSVASIAPQIALVIAAVTLLEKRIDELKEKAKKLAAVAISVAKSVIRGGIKLVSSAFSAMGATAKTAMAPIVSAAKGIGEKISDKVGGVIGKIKKAISSIGRVALYRAIRTALKEISQGFREGVDNVYMFSRALGGANGGELARSLDSIATAVLYLRNSLGALAAPIINTLAPVIDYLVDKFVALLNVINEAISALTGAATWTKAIKYPYTYADAAGLATGKVKELKRTILGFDEINALNGNNNNGGGSGASALDYSKMFSIEKTDSVFSQIKAMISGGEFYNAGLLLGETIFGGLNKAIDKFNAKQTVNNVTKKLKNAIDLIGGVLDSYAASRLGTKVGESFNTVLGYINTLLDGSETLKLGEHLGHFLNTAILAIDLPGVGSTFAKSVNVLFDELDAFINQFDVVPISEGFAHMLENAIKGVDEKKISKAIGDGVKKALLSIRTFTASFNWKGTATHITTTIRSMLNSVNWSDGSSSLGGTIGTLFNGVLDFLTTTAQTFPIQEACDALFGTIGRFLQSVDWATIGTLLSTLAQNAFASLELAAKNLGLPQFGKNLAATINRFLAETDWKAIGETLNSFFTGIMAGLYQFIKNIDVKDLANAITSLFEGLNRSSLVYEAIAVFSTIFKKVFDAVGEIVKNKIKTSITDKLPSWIKDLVPGLTVTSSSTMKPSSQSKSGSRLYAGGGFPSQGSAFIAGEVAGQYEFVGDINGRTGVVSGAEISGIGDAIRDGTAILASLMRQGNEYARETASKDYNPTVSVTDINNAQSRNNRRLGTTVAALAY